MRQTQTLESLSLVRFTLAMTASILDIDERAEEINMPSMSFAMLASAGFGT